MLVIPAIDLKDGRVVRLTQGDFERQEVMNDNPLKTAQYFGAQGAPELHLVDLDGARSGKPANKEVIADILQSTELKIQLGGGIRSKEIAAEYLELGAQAVVLGTAALQKPRLITELLTEWGPKRIIISLDARDGELAISGWEEGSGKKLNQVFPLLLERGVRRFVYTDISRDGTLKGPDLTTLKSLAAEDCEITASGGISSQEDLEYLEEIGISRAIIGKALYRGKLDPEKLWQVRE